MLPPAVGVAAYRIAQEALRNVVKHAGVTQADLVLAVGAACSPCASAMRGRASTRRPSRATEGGLGLIAMRQRAEAVGGRLTVAARPGGGTVVTAVFPTAPPR